MKVIYTGEIEKTNYIEVTARLIELASLFPTDAYIFLFKSFQAISQNDQAALDRLIQVLRLEKIQGIKPFVWRALLESKSKWWPAKDRSEIDNPEKILSYVRSIAWRLHRRVKREDWLDTKTVHYGLEPSDDLLAGIENPFDIPVNEIHLWHDIASIIKRDKTIKPEHKGDMVNLIRARIFADITRDKMPNFLGLEKNKIQAVWRETSRKEILKKINAY